MVFNSRDSRVNIDSLESVCGHTYSDSFSFDHFIDAYKGMGLQGSCLYEAIDILRTVRQKKIPIYLGITSNIGTCGLRESLSYLLRNGHVAALAATAGAVEEDVMKTFGDFKIGTYQNDDHSLFKSYISRTGNILIDNKIYFQLKLLLRSLNYQLWLKYWKNGQALSDTDYIFQIGCMMDKLDIPRRSESFVYQSYKNNIPIYCPALMDGAIGDNLYLFTRERRSLGFDSSLVVLDHCQSTINLINQMQISKKNHDDVCLLAIGGSVPKHMICNSAIYIDGAKYCIYINTSSESEGSNAGAPVSEAITWGKVHPEARSVKIHAEASLVFPLLVAAAFQTWNID